MGNYINKNATTLMVDFNINKLACSPYDAIGYIALGLYIQHETIISVLKGEYGYVYYILMGFVAAFIGFLGVNFKLISKFIASFVFFFAYLRVLMDNRKESYYLISYLKDKNAPKEFYKVVKYMCIGVNYLTLEQKIFELIITSSISVFLAAAATYYKIFFSIMLAFLSSYYYISPFIPDSNQTQSLKEWIIVWICVFLFFLAVYYFLHNFVLAIFFADIAFLIAKECYFRIKFENLSDAERYPYSYFEHIIYFVWLIVSVVIQFVLPYYVRFGGRPHPDEILTDIKPESDLNIEAKAIEAKSVDEKTFVPAPADEKAVETKPVDEKAVESNVINKEAQSEAKLEPVEKKNGEGETAKPEENTTKVVEEAKKTDEAEKKE